VRTVGSFSSGDGPVLGIDLGTRYALCAVFDDAQGPLVVPNRWGKRSTPSVTAWTGNGWTAGETAAAGEMKHPSTTWWDLKRKVGTPWKGRCGRASVSAEDALVPLLTLLREDGEAFLGTFVEACVLAVPASFSFAERSAMARAARSAGFSRLRIVNEPTAAALAFGSSGRFLILDYGAGTVDLSVVECGGGVWQVIESSGTPSCGGRDFDAALAVLLAEKSGINPGGADSPLHRMLLSEAEEVKIALSACLSHEWTPPAGPGASSVTVTRREFEDLVRPSLERVVAMAASLRDEHGPAKLLLVGGGSRIPLLRTLLAERVARPEHLSRCPDEAVVTGAALYGSRAGTERLLLDVLSDDLGILAADGTPVPLLEKGMHLPARVGKKFTSVGSGPFILRVFQGDRNRVISTVRIPDAEKGESITLVFAVDSGGLLRMDILREDGRAAVIPPLEVGSSGASSFDPQPEDLLDLEKRFAMVSPVLSPAQQARGELLFRTVKSLRDEGYYPEGAEFLEQMVAEMERVIR
jgi:molecular chaperone DnaK